MNGPANPHLRAALLMMGSTVFFGLMAVAIRCKSFKEAQAKYHAAVGTKKKKAKQDASTDAATLAKIAAKNHANAMKNPLAQKQLKRPLHLLRL